MSREVFDLPRWFNWVFLAVMAYAIGVLIAFVVALVVHLVAVYA